jgi:GGDEF domain-containing protein
MTLSTLTHEHAICTTCLDKDTLIAQLTAERDAAEFDGIWGIYKREGIERRLPQLTAAHATIVIDLDGMHDSNREFGHAGVDVRVTTLMALLRKADADLLIGRWERGDEIVMFPREADAVGMAYRLLGGLLALGMSATMAIVRDNTRVGIALGIARVEVAKEANERGRVFVIEGALG